MALVKINAMTGKVTCKPGASAECGFDVINPGDARLRVGLEVTGDVKEKGWAKLQTPLEVDLPPKGQEKIKVSVSIPATAEAKNYSLKLRVFDVQNPERAEESAAVAVAVAADEKKPEPQPGGTTKGPPWGLIIGGIVGGLVLIGGIVTLIIIMSGGGSVPDVTTLTQEAAQAALEKEGLVVGNVTQEVSAEPVGTVIGQDPPADADIPEDKAVDLVLAMVEAKEPVPNYIGQSLVDVLKAMNKAKLVQGKIGEQLSGEASGTVVAQDPGAGTEMPADQTIDLVISQLSVEVPRVLGFDVTKAQNALIAGGLQIGKVEAKETGNAHGGTVLEQSPEPAQRALPGMKVHLVVEKTVVTVPSLMNVSYEEAKKRLDEVGLLVGKTDTANTGAQELTIIGQTPEGGTKVDPGTQVNVLIEGKKIEVPDVVNRDLAYATSALTRAGLKVAAVTSEPADSDIGTIKSQDPAAKTPVPPGSDVRLVQRSLRYAIPIRAEVMYMTPALVKNATRLQKTFAGSRVVEPEDVGVAPEDDDGDQ